MANSIISKASLAFIPLRIVFLFLILFIIVLFNAKRYYREVITPEFWTTILFTYLLPVSVVTILILLPLDFVWILRTGYEFPLNYFLFLKNPLIIRVVKICFDAFFSFILTDFIMRISYAVFKSIVNPEIYHSFREENKRNELKKVIVSLVIIFVIYISAKF